MVSITVGFRQARVWTDNAEGFDFKGIQHRQVTIASTTPGLHPRRATVEFYIPVGARCLYGALGAEFLPSGSHQLELQVMRLRQGETGTKLPWALASKVDEVWAGLPLEYADAILDSAQLVPEIMVLGSGTLTFDRAAYGVVSSNANIFKRLTASVIRLLAVEKVPTDESVRGLLDL